MRYQRFYGATGSSAPNRSGNDSADSSPERVFAVLPEPVPGTDPSAASGIPAIELLEWTVYPELNRIEGPAGEVTLEPRVMKVLQTLCDHAPQVVTKDELIETVWEQKFVTDEVLTNAIWSLRQAFGDKARNSKIVGTVRGRGYRMVCPVVRSREPCAEASEVAMAPPLRETDGLDLSVAVDSSARLDSGDSVVARRLLSPLLATVLLILAIVVPTVGWRLRTPLGDRQIGLSDGLTIAVLPIEDLTGDKEVSHLAGGIRADLTGRLGEYVAVRVLSRASADLAFEAEQDRASIGDLLGADVLIEGTLMADQGQLQLSLAAFELVPEDLVFSETLTGERYESRDLSKRFVASLADILTLELTEDLPRQTAYEPNPAAYDLYLRAWELLAARKPESRQGIALLEQALELDPDFARGWALLSERLPLDMAGQNYYPVKQAALRALELDDRLPEAHLAVARVIGVYEWRWEDARAEIRRAIELDPNLAQARQYYSRYLSLAGYHEEATRQIEEAVRLDPNSIETQLNVGRVHYYAGRWLEAAAVAEALIDARPDVVPAKFLLGTSLIELEEYERAIDLLGKGENSVTSYGELGLAYALGGHLDEAAEVLRQLEISDRRPSLQISLIRLAFGDETGALDELELGFESRQTDLCRIGSDPHFDLLRDEPRFQELVRLIGFPNPAPRGAKHEP